MSGQGHITFGCCLLAGLIPLEQLSICRHEDKV